MNLRLPQVVTDITGETGMAIVRAIVAGERDSVTLARFRNVRCKSSEETIAKALTGTWKEEHVFALTQTLEAIKELWLAFGERLTYGALTVWMRYKSSFRSIRDSIRTLCSSVAID